MTRALVLTNNKGGVGKSTSATNIALGVAALLRQASAKNRRVLLIDTARRTPLWSPPVVMTSTPRTASTRS